MLDYVKDKKVKKGTIWGYHPILSHKCLSIYHQGYYFLITVKNNNILCSQISCAPDCPLIISHQPANEEGHSIISSRSMLSVDMSKCDESEESDESKTN